MAGVGRGRGQARGRGFGRGRGRGRGNGLAYGPAPPIAPPPPPIRIPIQNLQAFYRHRAVDISCADEDTRTYVTDQLGLPARLTAQSRNWHVRQAADRSAASSFVLSRLGQMRQARVLSFYGSTRDLFVPQYTSWRALGMLPSDYLGIDRETAEARGCFFDIADDLEVEMTLYAPDTIPGEQVTRATMARRVQNLPQGYAADLAVVCDVYHFTQDDLASLLDYTDTVYVLCRYFPGEAGAFVYEDGEPGGAWWRNEEGLIYRPDHTSPSYPGSPDLNWLFESKCHVGRVNGRQVLMNCVYERSFGHLSCIRVQVVVGPTLMTTVQQAPPPVPCVQALCVNPPYFSGWSLVQRWQAFELQIMEFFDPELRDPKLMIWGPAMALATNLASRPLHGQSSDAAIRAVDQFLAKDLHWQRLTALRVDPTFARRVSSDTAAALRNTNRREIVGKLHADKRRDALMLGKIEELRNPKGLEVDFALKTWTLRLLGMAAIGAAAWYWRPVAKTIVIERYLPVKKESSVALVTAAAAAVSAAFGSGGLLWPEPPELRLHN